MEKIGSVTGDTVLNHDFTQYKEIYLNCYLHGHSFGACQIPSIALPDGTGTPYTILASYNKDYGNSSLSVYFSKTSLSIRNALVNNADQKAKSNIGVYAR